MWEHFTGKQLSDLPQIGATTTHVFDPTRYITRKSRRDARWHVAFNGPGSLRYCARVSRSPAIEAGMRANILGRAKAFAETLGGGILDHALTWAHLHETEDSFAIEREAPSEDKARLFIALLHQAHEGRPLSEEYLVELQNSVLTNPFVKAASYRGGQNWLRGPGRGWHHLRSPPPRLAKELMDELHSFANTAPREIDPVAAAAIAAFGFVFIHPFMDGNGRLSRFIFHHSLCRSGQLERGLLLPVSIAMKRNEDQYLATLQHYSRQTREHWSIRWIDADDYDLRFQGADAIYRYWDATRCVEFGYQMAEQALEVDLRQETEFLVRYDHIIRAVDERFDVQGSTLSTLVVCCLDNGGKLSRRRRRQ